MSSIIDSLRSDHSRMTKLLDALERQIGRFEEGGLIDFEIADGILHIMMEEKHFFPAAERSLTPEDWQAIQRAREPGVDPLFEHREDDRFDALYRDIVDWDRQLPAGA